jgi:hypothetical protein
MTEVDTPRPDAGEVLVRVASSSVNAFDVHLAGDGDQLAGLLRPGGRFASTLGFNPAGRITAFPSVMANATPQTLARLAADAASGVLRIPVTVTYPLERVGEAFGAFGAGMLGKVAITCT